MFEYLRSISTIIGIFKIISNHSLGYIQSIPSIFWDICDQFQPYFEILAINTIHILGYLRSHPTIFWDICDQFQPAVLSRLKSLPETGDPFIPLTWILSKKTLVWNLTQCCHILKQPGRRSNASLQTACKWSRTSCPGKALSMRRSTTNCKIHVNFFLGRSYRLVFTLGTIIPVETV